MHLFFFLSLSFKKSKVSQSFDPSAVKSRDSEELPDVPPWCWQLEPAGSISCVEGESFREAGEESRGSHTFSLANSRVQIFSVDFSKAKRSQPMLVHDGHSVPEG